MSKGDSITVIVAGIMTDGIAVPYVTEASQAGRTVEYEFEPEGKIQWIVVREKTRGGTVVNERRFPADHVRVLTRHAKEI